MRKAVCPVPTKMRSIHASDDCPVARSPSSLQKGTVVRLHCQSIDRVSQFKQWRGRDQPRKRYMRLDSVQATVLREFSSRNSSEIQQAGLAKQIVITLKLCWLVRLSFKSLACY